MKNKKVFVSPNVKGVYVLQSSMHQNDSSIKDYKKSTESEESDAEQENKIKEIKALQDEAYRNGKLDAENKYEQELNEIKNRYTSLMTVFQDAVKHLIDKRERILQESEPEIVRLILATASKVIGNEVSNNSIGVVKQVIREALSHAKEKKIVCIRLSIDDAKKMDELNEIQITDQNIKIVEDKTISSGGCVIDTNFGSIDSRIETRWEEISKTLLANKKEMIKH